MRLGVSLVLWGCAGAEEPQGPTSADDELPAEGQIDVDAGEPEDASDAAADASVLDAGDAALDASAPDGGASSDASAAADAGHASDAGDAGDAGCSALTYESFGKGFVDTYCIRCHGATSRVFSLDTLESVKSYAARLESAVVVNRTMPVGKTLPSDEERARFGAFLACGPR